MSADGAALVRAVRAAVDDAQAELAAMPFLIRPMVKRGFASRTGRSHGDWLTLLDGIAAATPAEAARRVPGLDAALAALEDNFRTAPERARRGMGNDPVAIAQVEARARVRTAAVGALRAWLTGS